MLELLRCINEQKALEAAASSEWKLDRFQAERETHAEAGKHCETLKLNIFSGTL